MKKLKIRISKNWKKNVNKIINTVIVIGIIKVGNKSKK